MLRLVFFVLLTASAIVVLSLLGCGSGKDTQVVVLFTSLDQMFSEPIAREFEKRTGIKVQFQTDAETAKTVGLVNRLIARKDHPEADVFWNNETGQTLVLKEQGLLEPYTSPAAETVPGRYRDAAGYWTGFAARARVILYNTQMLKAEDAPRRVRDLCDPKYKDQVVMALPLTGTTFTHAAILFAKLGPDAAKQFFNELKSNGVMFVPGNATAMRKVAEGERAICLTDTDDANAALLKGKPVAMCYPDQEGDGAIVIPNTVMLIRNAPHPENARKLIDFLLSADVEQRLAQSESAQLPLRPGLKAYSAQYSTESIRAMEVDWAAAARQFPAVKAFFEAQVK